MRWVVCFQQITKYAWIHDGYSASQAGDVALIEVLASRGGDVNAPDKRHGRTPLGWAASQVWRQSSACFAVAIALILAFMKGDEGATLFLLQNPSVRVDMHDSDGFLPLHWFLRTAQVRLLLIV